MFLRTFTAENLDVLHCLAGEILERDNDEVLDVGIETDCVTTDSFLICAELLVGDVDSCVELWDGAVVEIKEELEGFELLELTLLGVDDVDALVWRDDAVEPGSFVKGHKPGLAFIVTVSLPSI